MKNIYFELVCTVDTEFSIIFICLQASVPPVDKRDPRTVWKDED